MKAFLNLLSSPYNLTEENHHFSWRSSTPAGYIIFPCILLPLHAYTDIVSTCERHEKRELVFFCIWPMICPKPRAMNPPWPLNVRAEGVYVQIPLITWIITSNSSDHQFENSRWVGKFSFTVSGKIDYVLCYTSQKPEAKIQQSYLYLPSSVDADIF